MARCTRYNIVIKFVSDLWQIGGFHRAGADPGFQVRGGALKKIAPSGGKRENFWGISCEKSRFYAKKSYFFQLRREAQNLLGYFVWKITILRQKIIFFPILGGGAGCASPWIRPCRVLRFSSTNKTDRHDITEIFLKVPLNTIKQTIKKLLKTQHLSVVLFSVLSIYCACVMLLFKH